MAKPHVLVVDDNQSMRDVLSMTFDMEGFTTTTAKSGEEAWGLIHHNSPDIIILDVNLAGRVTGIDVLRALRRDPRIAHIKVVLLTAEHPAAGSPAAEAADVILLKPADPDQLISLAYRLLGVKMQ